MTWPPKPPRYSPAVQAKIDALVAKPKRGPRKHMEQDEQIALVGMLRLLTIPPARFWFCPNGGNLSEAQRMRFKAMGLTPGVSDMHFVWRAPDYPSWSDGQRRPGLPCYGVIEMKAGKGRESDEQTRFIADCAACGHGSAVCWSAEEAMTTLRAWGFPLRMAHLGGKV